MITNKILSFLIGYAFGNILLGYILGKLSHVDLRKEGSGNVGTTNTTRILGVKKGLLTLVLDVGKGFLAAGTVWLFFHAREGISSEEIKLLMIYAAFGAVIGHDFPFYMGFKGGKGVATSLSFLAILDIRAMILAAVVFVTTLLVTHYVSLGSVLGDVAVIIYMVFFGGFKTFMSWEGSAVYEVAVMLIIAASLLLIRHKDNIKRLLAGNENKFSIKHSAQ